MNRVSRSYRPRQSRDRRMQRSDEGRMNCNNIWDVRIYGGECWDCTGRVRVAAIVLASFSNLDPGALAFLTKDCCSSPQSLAPHIAIVHKITPRTASFKIFVNSSFTSHRTHSTACGCLHLGRGNGSNLVSHQNVVIFYQTTRCYFTRDDTVHSHRSLDLRYYHFSFLHRT
jgi:hypothetical protein